MEQSQNEKKKKDERRNILVEDKKQANNSSHLYRTEEKESTKKGNFNSSQLDPSQRAIPSIYNANCRFDVFCTRDDCKFRHPPWAKRNAPILKNSIKRDAKATNVQKNVHVNLITWNTLASPLAISMKKNGKYDEKVLNEEPRTALLLKELKQKMNRRKSFQGENKGNGILCLQEITQDLARGKLNKLCVENKYMSFFSPYGTNSNGFMGNMVLVPAESYKIIHSSEFVVSEHTELPIAKGYPNIMQIVILSDNKTSTNFIVANYHMPCQWQNPVVMTEHVKACIYLLEHYNLPILFAGDFNFTPKDTYYSLMCRDFNGIWNDKDLAGSEKSSSPQDTTYSFVKAEFRGCIDHIFYSKNKTTLLSIDPIETLYNIIPDKYHPSDHLPVCAAFSLET